MPNDQDGLGYCLVHTFNFKGKEYVLFEDYSRALNWAMNRSYVSNVEKAVDTAWERNKI